MYFNIKTFVFTKMVCWDASLSCAEGRMVSSRAQICDHRPLTGPSRITVKSLKLIHSHRKTCPVMATTSTRKPSPETWSDTRVEFSISTKIKQHKNQKRVKNMCSLFSCCVYLEQKPSDEVFLGPLSQSLTGPYPCSTETVLLTPAGHKATSLQWEIYDKSFTVWTVNKVIFVSSLTTIKIYVIYVKHTIVWWSHCHHMVEEWMDFRNLLLGASRHHVDLTDPLVV